MVGGPRPVGGGLWAEPDRALRLRMPRGPPENSSSNVPPQIESPPLPVPVGSPPWTMKLFIFRWKVVPLYWPAAQSARKLKAAFGTMSQAISILISPSDVWSVTLMVTEPRRKLNNPRPR